jgi:heavy-metal-associated domain-containing protein
MRPYAYIPHHIVGQRLRLKIEDATPRLLGEIQNRVSKLRYVQSTDINPATGSVLITYFRNNSGDLCQDLSERLADLITFTRESRSGTGEYSTTAIDLLKIVKSADDGLRNSTSGRLDLKLLFPLAMVGLTALTLPTNLQTPLWLSFLMFGFSSFESMHTGALEQPAGKTGEEHESNAAGGASQG